MPYTQECNDVAMMLIQHHKASEYHDRAIDQFEQLYHDSANSAARHGAGGAPLHHGRAAPAQILPPHARKHQPQPDVVFWTGEQILDWYSRSSARRLAAGVRRCQLFQLLNGLTFAALLFVVASGFTLIFGLLRIVNLAHGALYLFGGYIGYTVAAKTGSFVLGGIGRDAGVAVIGLVLDQGLLRFVRGFELRQVLLTLGVAFVLNDLALVIWGGDTFTVPMPEMLRGAVVGFGVFYPKYRLFVLLVGMLVFIGAVAAAQSDAARRAHPRRSRRCRDGRSHGHQHPPRVSRRPSCSARRWPGSADCWAARSSRSIRAADAEILVFSLAVVIIGGRGSLVGAAVGACWSACSIPSAR